MPETDIVYIIIEWLEAKEQDAEAYRDKCAQEEKEHDYHYALGMWGAFKATKEMLLAAQGRCENETQQWNDWTKILNAIRTEMWREEMIDGWKKREPEKADGKCPACGAILTEYGYCVSGSCSWIPPNHNYEPEKEGE